MIIPAKVFVEDDGSTETSCRVDTSSSDWDCGQVHQEHSEPNWQGCQNLIISFIQKHKIISYMNNIYIHELIQFNFLHAHTGTCESLALHLASVAEKTV